MPRAVDKRPQARGVGNALYNPNRSGIASWEDPYSAIDDTVAQAGEGIRKAPSDPLRDTWNALFQAFTGNPDAATGDPDTGWQWPDVQQSATDMRRELTEISAITQEIVADRNAQYVSGQSTTITVAEHVGIPIGLVEFHAAGDGDVFNDGNSLQMSNDTGRRGYVYGDLQLQTNSFEVSVGVSKWATSYLGLYGTQYIYLFGRADDPVAPTTFTFLRIGGGNTVRAGAVKAGTPNDSLTNPHWFGDEVTFPRGSYLTFTGGIPGEDRAFQLRVNRKVREAFTDDLDFSAVGEDYRYTGLIIENQHFNDGYNRSFSISHFSINDNAPPPVIGVACKLIRSNPGNQLMSGSGAGTDYEMVDTFDDVAYITPDYFEILDLDLGVIRIKRDGHYRVDFRAEAVTVFYSANASAPPHYLMPFIVKNGAVGPRGIAASSARDGFGNSLGVKSMSLHTPMWLHENDIIAPRFNIGSSIVGNSWIGDADGNNTFFAITLDNWSTA